MVYACFNFVKYIAKFSPFITFIITKSRATSTFKLEGQSVNLTTVGLPLCISATIGSKNYSFFIDAGSTLSLIPYEPS